MTRVEKLLLCLLAVPFGIGFLAPGSGTEPVTATTVFSFADPEIVESSGLVARDGLVVTVNDSGDSNRIFTVDPATGETVGVTRWQGDATDIEALAPADQGHVYVGDTGDNAANRDHVVIARVPFGRGDREVHAMTYDLTYPDGSHDAETLLVHPTTGQVLVVAKEFIGRLYAAPETLEEQETNELREVDEVLGIATDGAFFPDGRHLVLRNYTQAAIYTWPDLDRVALLDLPEQQQGEGIAVSGSGDVLLSSEGLNAEVLRVDLPAEVLDRLAAGPTAPVESSTPDESGAGSGVGSDDGGAPGSASDDSWPGVLTSPWVLGLAGLATAAVVVVLVRRRA